MLISHVIIFRILIKLQDLAPRVSCLYVGNRSSCLGHAVDMFRMKRAGKLLFFPPLNHVIATHLQLTVPAPEVFNPIHTCQPLDAKVRSLDLSSFLIFYQRLGQRLWFFDHNYTNSISIKTVKGFKVRKTPATRTPESQQIALQKPAAHGRWKSLE